VPNRESVNVNGRRWAVLGTRRLGQQQQRSVNVNGRRWAVQGTRRLGQQQLQLLLLPE
jgi:hypothetical protein